ncbi:MAG TPA: hypothetical protein VK489_02340 [Ferruginibacter sp.]|nr:hypothetical protein [Ferruginibacter sp.]
MKKNLLFAILGFALILFTTSCSKDDPDNGGNNNTSIEGKWVGNYNNGLGGPLFYLAATFNAGGTLLVQANNNSAPDIANGTWTMGADSVRATFTYVGGTAATYSIAGKYSSNSNVMVGTIGLGTSTSGAGIFTITKE